MKTIIISQPKAGTYLLSEVLKNCGLTQSYLHLGLKSYTRYHQDRILEGRHHPEKFRTMVSLDKSVSLVGPGEFAASHLECSSYTKQCLVDFKKVILTRDSLELRESWNRFYNGEIRPLRKFDPVKSGKIFDWYGNDNLFGLSFADLTGKNSEVIDKLQIFLHGEVLTDSKNICDRSLSADTITKSNIRE